MWALDFAFIRDNSYWTAQLAAGLVAITLLAGGLLNQARKDEIALWLMGAQSERNWAKSFTTLFDALFGERHFTWRCFLTSTVVSLAAVLLIWLAMGGTGALGLRIRAELSLGVLLPMALAVNVLADYVSLLETRWLLGRLHRWRAWPVQLAVLALDAVLTGAIIWLAIAAYLASPLHGGEVESFAEILGVFSIFSVLFYSTFLTSAWTWAYILSTWLMRLLAALRLGEWLDLERQPIRVLACVLGLVTFTGALALAAPLRADEEGISAADRALCTLFKGRVCLDVAELTPTEQAQLDFILLACEGGVTRECLDRANDIWEVDGAQAARLFRAACDGGNPTACNNLGALHARGIGIRANPREAARLYRRGCDRGDPLACTNLGFLRERGFGGPADVQEAAQLYRWGCDAGDAGGCTNLGALHVEGIGMKADPKEGARLFRQGCDGGHALGCTNLGYLHERGIGMEADPQEAARLYRLGCDAGDAGGCTNLGALHVEGIGMKADATEGARLFRQGCDGGEALGCTNLGYLQERGIGMEADPQQAARLYRQGCDGGDARGCTNLGYLHDEGIGMDPDPAAAARLYRQGCELGDEYACDRADALAAE